MISFRTPSRSRPPRPLETPPPVPGPPGRASRLGELVEPAREEGAQGQFARPRKPGREVRVQEPQGDHGAESVQVGVGVVVTRRIVPTLRHRPFLCNRTRLCV